ncbi:hypothetical protein LTR95_004339 [Oleoguttula sp. CCFEE 5521]
MAPLLRQRRGSTATSPSQVSIRCAHVSPRTLRTTKGDLGKETMSPGSHRRDMSGQAQRPQLVKMPWTWPPPHPANYTPSDPDALGLEVLSIHVDKSLDSLHLGLVHVTQLTPLDLLKLDLLHQASIPLDESLARGLKSLRDEDKATVRSISELDTDLGYAIGSAIGTFVGTDYFGHETGMDIIALQSPHISCLNLALGAPALISHGTTATVVSNFHATLRHPSRSSGRAPVYPINAHPDLSNLRVAGLTATQTPDEPIELARPFGDTSFFPRPDPETPSRRSKTDSPRGGEEPSVRSTSGRNAPVPPKLNRFDSAITPPVLARDDAGKPDEKLKAVETATETNSKPMRDRLRTLGLALCAAEAMTGRPICLDTPVNPHPTPNSHRPVTDRTGSDSTTTSNLSDGTRIRSETSATGEGEGGAAEEWAVGAQILLGANGSELRQKVARFWSDWPDIGGEALMAVEVAISAREPRRHD